MKCYRRILPIHWQQKITNVEIRQRLDIKKTGMQLIMERKLKLFWHICRMDDDNRLVKNVVFGNWNHRWTKQERKTEKRVDGRHQIMVSDRRANTQHHRAGPFGVETSCHGGIGHQAHGMKKNGAYTYTRSRNHIQSHHCLRHKRLDYCNSCVCRSSKTDKKIAPLLCNDW